MRLGLSLGLSARRAANPAVPVNTAPGTITGLAAPGNVLTAVNGTYTNVPISYSRQWTKNGADIPGATLQTYTVQAADGVNIRFREIATNGSGNSAPQISAACKYLGVVATNGRTPSNVGGGNKQMMSRSDHIKRSNSPDIGIVLPAWYWARTGSLNEPGAGGDIVYTASIEYPVGVFTQLLFGGLAGGTATNGNNLVSDLLTLAIPLGAMFWVRVFGDASAGLGAIVYNGGHGAGISSVSVCNTVNGQALTQGASGLTDQTMGGTVVQSGAAPRSSFAPLAIIGTTAEASVFLAGDSRCYGACDTPDATGDMGEIARSVGASLAYVNAGSFGDRVLTASTSGRYAKRGALSVYCSHVAVEYPINDITNGASAATALAGVQTLMGQLAAGRPYFPSTVSPVASSSNSFIDNAGQTPHANSAVIAAYNDLVRATPAGAAGYFEVADAVEDGRNSGKWKTDGTTFKYTVDGTHEGAFGMQAIKLAGSINPAVFVH